MAETQVNGHEWEDEDREEETQSQPVKPKNGVPKPNGQIKPGRRSSLHQVYDMQQDAYAIARRLAQSVLSSESKEEQAKLASAFSSTSSVWTKLQDTKREIRGTRMDPCIYWSGFGSQGDGACFEGTWRASDVQTGKVACHVGDKSNGDVEIRRIATAFEELAKTQPGLVFTVSHSGRYSHEHSTEFDFQWPDNEENEQCADIKTEEWATELSRDFMRWIYSQLQQEWEFQNSDEQVDESIRANQYEFTEDGKRA